ncbi:pilin [Pseudothauera rhizosphaerae]|uniref:pilin n=1 Tax=Pseudothauera rhizosphaerae TaxID=2565932 RepID=UPI001B3B1FC0|nr:prepilin-type N-terminal cleavage/methylation domain-containing protein [Pseudothauera rhizosphaerae]
MSTYRGFTLIELLMVIAIMGILAALAIGAYDIYVIRGQIAQTLTDYGHIRIVVGIETWAGGRTELQAGSVPGEVPPALATLLSRSEFNQLDNTTLQLVKAPAGTFAGFPDRDVYALIAAAGNGRGQRRLRMLRIMLPHREGDKIWLAENMLYFPLDVGPGGDAAAPVPPPGTITEPPVAPPVPPAAGDKTTGWDSAEATQQGSGWEAEARVCLGGSDGKPLASDLNAQVQIRVVQEVRTWDGQTTERSWLTQVPIVDGCATFSLSGLPLAGPGVEGVTATRFEVADVFYYWPTDPAVKWDGVKPVQRIPAPS